jgi:hypothetical protein
LAGAVNGTEAVAPDTVMVPIVGASGTGAGTKLFDGADSGLPPTSLNAWTVHL